MLQRLLLVALVLAPSATVDAQERVELKRMQVRLIDQQDYRVTLQLEPATLVDLVAPADGYLQSIVRRPGDKVTREVEVARMENGEAQFEYERAKALQRVAEIQLEIAKEKADSREIELAQANVEAAEAETQLQKLRYDRTSIRSPMEGVVFSAQANAGRFLRVGDRIATIGDTTTLKVEVPMNRADAVVGTEVDLVVADKTVKAKVERNQPLSPRFDAIRDIVNDVVSAILVVDNADSDFAVGQTVRTPLIPEHPICIVPNSAIGNVQEGGRKVQVIRENVIRDVPVAVLAGVGEETSYISGPLSEADELITSSSNPGVTLDGVEVRREATAATNQPPVRRLRPRDDDD